MGVLSDLDVLAHQAKRPCMFAQFLETLEVEDRRETEYALHEPNYSSAAIHAVLQGRGWVGAPTVLARHRRGACCCGNR